jgi:hypothetical protein
MTIQSNTPAPIMAKPVAVIGGHTGPSGGPTGPTGPEGPAAAIGPTGPQGMIGPLGTGPTGSTGAGAFTGPTGMTGPPGSLGASSTVTGPTGPSGPEGPEGPGAFDVHTANNWVAGPTGNVGLAEVHLGLGATFKITPQNSGLVFVIVSGMVMNSGAAGSGVNVRVRFNTGTAPVYGTAGAGNVLGAVQHFVSSTPAGQQGFCIHDIRGLSVGVEWWFDVTLTAVGAAGATVKDVQFSVLEF